MRYNFRGGRGFVLPKFFMTVSAIGRSHSLVADF